MQTRKTFEATANIIRTYRIAGYCDDEGQAALIYAFARAYSADNPRFDGMRFAKAAGLDPSNPEMVETWKWDDTAQAFRPTVTI